MEKPSKKKQHSSKPNLEDVKDQSNLMKYSGIAFEIVAFNLLLIWGGYKLDKAMENRIPWMIIAGLVLSVVGTIYFIFKRLNQN